MKLPATHPLHLWLWPCFFVLYNVNFLEGRVSPDTVGMAALGLLVLFALLGVLLSLTLGSKANTALLLLPLVILLFASQLQALPTHWGLPYVRTRYFWPCWLLASAIWAWAVFRPRFPSGGLTRYLNALLLVLVCYEAGLWAFRAVQHSGQPPSLFQKTAQATLDTQQPPRRPYTHTLPDIFLLVEDGYPSQATLQKRWQYNNRPFADSLQKLGFFYAHRSRSNYPGTAKTMPSMLNMRYLKPYHFGKAGALIGLADIKHNRTVRTLHGHGYRLHNLSIFEIEDQAPVMDMSDMWGGSHFFQFLALRTALRDVRHQINRLNHKGESLKWVGIRHKHLQSLAAAPAPLPRFVYFHSMAVHHPHDADHDGQVNSLRDFRHQIDTVNHHLLATLRQLTTGRPRPAIVLLVSDHGPRNGTFPGLPIPTADTYQNLTAVYFPDRDYRALYDSITPVNLMGIVLQKAVGAQFPPLPDRTGL